MQASHETSIVFGPRVYMHLRDLARLLDLHVQVSHVSSYGYLVVHLPSIAEVERVADHLELSVVEIDGMYCCTTSVGNQPVRFEVSS